MCPIVNWCHVHGTVRLGNFKRYQLHFNAIQTCECDKFLVCFCIKCRSVGSIAANQSPASTKPRLFESSILVNKTWGAVKSAGSTIKNTTQQAASIATNQIRAKSASKDPLKIEKRISDELHKIFDDTDSFYYCLDADITNNLQRMNEDEIDDRFFWNKYMIRDIMELEVNI